MGGKRESLGHFARNIPFTKGSDTSFMHVCTFCVADVVEAGTDLRTHLAKDNDTVQEIQNKYKEHMKNADAEKERLLSAYAEAQKNMDGVVQSNKLLEHEVKKLKKNVDSATSEKMKTLEAQLKAEKESNIILIATAKDLHGKCTLLNETVDKQNERIDELKQINEKLKSANPRKRPRPGVDPNAMDCSYDDGDDAIIRLENSITEIKAQQDRILAIVQKSHESTSSQGTVKQNTAPLEPTTPGPITIKPVPFSLARLMKNTEQSSKFIRHINGKGTDRDTREKNFNLFKSDKRVMDMNMEVIREKGPNSVTVRLANVEAVTKLEKFVAEHASELVELKGVQMRPAMIKIVRVPTDLRDKDLLAVKMKENNPSLADANFNVDQVFEIVVGDRAYVNCILICDIDVQESLISLGSITFGLSKCRVYEHIELLQCNNCSQSGHIGINCTNKIACRKCGDEHKHTECSSSTLKCVNCVIQNSLRKTNLGTAHNAAHDLCYSRKERINAIKKLIAPKN